MGISCRDQEQEGQAQGDPRSSGSGRALQQAPDEPSAAVRGLCAGLGRAGGHNVGSVRQEQGKAGAVQETGQRHPGPGGLRCGMTPGQLGLKSFQRG